WVDRGWCCVTSASFPGGRVRIGKRSEGDRRVQGIQVCESALVDETRRQERGRLDDGVVVRRWQRHGHLQVRAQRRTECPPPRGYYHRHVHTGGGRQESSWASGRDNLPGRAHGPFPVPRRVVASFHAPRRLSFSRQIVSASSELSANR